MTPLMQIQKLHSFIVVNCAGIPESLLESELFGYKKELSPVPIAWENTKKYSCLSLIDKQLYFLSSRSIA